jgi:hypothetical protein
MKKSSRPEILTESRGARRSAGGPSARYTTSATCGGIDAAVAMEYDLFMDDEPALARTLPQDRMAYHGCKD